MNYREGAWHAIIGLNPQYEHMMGCPAYDKYMQGYNETFVKKTETKTVEVTEMDMRERIRNEIENFREREQGFDSRTTRWGNWFFKQNEGIVFFSSRKEQKQSGAIHLKETTTKDFAGLSDENLLKSYTLIIRQRYKQM